MLIQAAVSFGTVIMFGSAGEILTEKSGNLNLGVPGMMYLSAALQALRVRFSMNVPVMQQAKFRVRSC